MRRLVVAFSIVSSAAGWREVAAQGFSINEHSACSVARAGAGVARPCDDGSAMVYNPAGLLDINGSVISLGLSALDINGNFTDDLTGTPSGRDNGVISIPSIFIARSFSPQIVAGVGITLPYRLGVQWPTTFDGRFNAYDTDLKSFYVQPTVAYRITQKLVVGGGVDFVFGSFELNQRLDLSETAVGTTGTLFSQLGIPFHTDFADVQLKGTGATGTGLNVGAIYRISDRVTLGGRYLHEVTLDYDGTAAFAPVSTGILLPEDNPFGLPTGTSLDEVAASFFGLGGALVNQRLTTSITMPRQLILGLSFDANEYLAVLADYQWTEWSVFDLIPLDFERVLTPDRTIFQSYTNTHAVRFAFDWSYDERIDISGGYSYNTAAAPEETVTPLLPDAARNTIAMGASFQFTPTVRGSFAYQYLRQNKRRGRVVQPPAGIVPTAGLNSGLYSVTGNILTTTVIFGF